jgi:hypothetical protein
MDYGTQSNVSLFQCADPSAALRATRKVNTDHFAIIPFNGIHRQDCQSLIMVCNMHPFQNLWKCRGRSLERGNGGFLLQVFATDYFGEMIFNGGKQVWRQSKTSIRGDPKDFSPPGRAGFFTACPFFIQISQIVPWVLNIPDKPRAILHLTHNRTPGTHNKWSPALQSDG